MPPARLPANEAERLSALRGYSILDTQAEVAFDELVRLGSNLTGHPIALVSLVDAERQWFKARHGLDATETHRDMAFCSHAILEPSAPLSVPDATQDPRFRDNPLVTSAPDIRAYLGVPLVTSAGHALGTFCVIDRVPRQHDPAMIETVQVLSRAVMANLELRRAVRQVEAAALTDPLTGLPNRRAAVDLLEAALARREPMAAVALDLDHFKEANDAYGHGAGDAILREVAARLRKATRPGDIPVRFGGDEFVVFLAGTATAEGVVSVAGRLVRALSDPVSYEGTLLRTGATAGVAVAPDDAASAEALLRLADEALIGTKRLKRGSVGRATAADAHRVAREAAVMRFLKEADPVSLPHLSAYLQPVVDLRSGHPVGLEALARCYHPEIGTISPEELLATAERIGLSHAVSRQVRAHAFAAFAGLRRDGLAPSRIAVNVSAAELLRSDVVDVLEAQVAAAGLDASSLSVEITEDALLARVAKSTTRRLAELRGHGMRIALDDFGTGTSGLSQLLHVPLDALKLDRTFVARLGTDERAERVVEGVVRLAASMRLEVVAEGVETEGQAAMLRSLGCDFAQGWLFGRAMALPDLREWLVAHHGGGLNVVPLRGAARAG